MAAGGSMLCCVSRQSTSEDASWLASVLRFARSLAVGGAATLCDWATLALLVELGHWRETSANVPALLVGAAAQFFGCRHLVFAAARGNLKRQLAGFAAVEAATLALNGLAFHLLVTLTPAPYWMARPTGTFVVFAVLSYPLWKLVFRGSLKTLSVENQTAGP